MKKFDLFSSFFLLIILMASSIITEAQTIRPSELLADYGPPSQANTWEKFTIPLTPESFNTDSVTFASVMENITSFWIKTEMHTGDDIGGIDEVMIGETYWSYFDSSSELWSSGGDGTMEWMPSNGVNDGYLQISDWATGAYHWLIAPSSWAGDWSGLIGQNIEFWFKTDRPSYSAAVKLTSETVYRLVINTPISNTIPMNDSILIQLEIIPPLTEELTISLTSSDNSCVKIPATVLVPAGDSTAYVYFSAAIDATVGCESVIEATANDYLSSRVTIMVKGYSGLSDPVASHELVVTPNPSNGQFMILNDSGKNIERIIMYDLNAAVVLDMQGKDFGNTDIIMPDQSTGMYFIKIFMQDQVLISKVIIK